MTNEARAKYPRSPGPSNPWHVTCSLIDCLKGDPSTKAGFQEVTIYVEVLGGEKGMGGEVGGEG